MTLPRRLRRWHPTRRSTKTAVVVGGGRRRRIICRCKKKKKNKYNAPHLLLLLVVTIMLLIFDTLMIVNDPPSSSSSRSSPSMVFVVDAWVMMTTTSTSAARRLHPTTGGTPTTTVSALAMKRQQRLDPHDPLFYRRVRQRRRRRRRQPHHSLIRLGATATTSSSVDGTASEDKKLVLYNSLTRSKEPFQSLSDKRKVSMYTCGPTVYDYAHIGNFRAFLTYDVVKRTLLYLGYDVDHVCNLTDVDDKIIKRANEQGLDDVTKLTRHFEQCFFDDLAALNIVPASHYPRATEHIDGMMNMVLGLRDAGLAYETDDGSWYFDTQARPQGSSSTQYGQQLVQLNYDDMQEQHEVENTDGKRHFADFCLWKAFKTDGPVPDRLDCAWERRDDGNNEITLGRPGWHLECSAMAAHFFGSDQTIDLHGGGIDLKFPHHENEIAQSEGIMNSANTVVGMPAGSSPSSSSESTPSRKRFCNCWFHNGFVNIGGDKMSKSLGYFLRLRQACPTAQDVRAYRYLIVSSQYRNPVTFTETAMNAAKNAIKRIDKVVNQLEEAVAVVESSESTTTTTDSSNSGRSNSDLAKDVVPAAMENFCAAILDDLSMPRASASLFTLVKAAENEFKRLDKAKAAAAGSSGSDIGAPPPQLDVVGLQCILDAIKDMDRVFGILYKIRTPEGEESSVDEEAEVAIPSDVLDLVSQRTAAKQVKDWELG